MQPRSRRASLLLSRNWLLFAGMYVWISFTQGNLLWWLRLNWSGWLNDFSALTTLGLLPAGSFWILWLMSSLLLTAVYLARGSQNETPAVEAPVESAARKQLLPNADLIESRPELKEKILRLHESLDKI